MIRLFFFALILLNISCATNRGSSTARPLSGKLDRYVDVTLDNIYKKWGPPSRSSDVREEPLKQVVWTFDGRSAVANQKAWVEAIEKGEPSETKNLSCSVLFAVDRGTGTIRSWATEGKACEPKFFNSGF